MTTMSYRSLALTAVAAGAVGLAGCGGDDAPSGNASGGSSNPNTLLVNTFKPGSGGGKIKSGTIELSVKGTFATVSGDAKATIKLNEAKDGNVPEFAADVDVNAKQTNGRKIDFQAGGVFTDNRFYINYDGENYDVGEEFSKRAVDSLKKSIAQSNSGASNESKELLGKLGLEPDTWLKNPQVDGEEEIGGVDAYKISGEVDVKAIVPDILDAARRAQALTPGAARTPVPQVTDAELDQAAKQIEKLDVAIWTGKDDNILRQVTVDIGINGEKENSDVDGQLKVTLTDVNEEQDIEAPSDTKPITDLMPKLGGLFGAVSGAGGAGLLGGGGAAAGGTSAGAASSAVSEAYVKCVNDAGGDAAKLNACQEQLPR